MTPHIPKNLPTHAASAVCRWRGGAALALVVAGATCAPRIALAEDWQVYYNIYNTLHQIDAQSIRSEGGKVFYRYREYHPNADLAAFSRPIEAVVDCVSRQRSDVAADGSYTLRDIYSGTGQARQLDRACELAAGTRTAGQPLPNSVIRLVEPPSRGIDLRPHPRAAPLKVAFVYVGPVGDGGWTFAHDRGRRGMEADLRSRVEVSWVERVPEGAAAVPVLQRLVDEGNRLIFTTAFGYGEAVQKVAAANPGVRFEHATGYLTARNVRTYEARTDEGAYLAGIVAGGVTRTGTIGFVASVPIPEMIRNIDAFTLGARSVNPDVRTRVAWVGEWFNPPKEAAAAEALIAQGADVLLPNTDSSAVLSTAERLGKRAFGWDSDMRAYGPKAHLGSVVMNWAPYYAKAVRDALDGTWRPVRTSWGVAYGAVDMVSLADDIPSDTRRRLADAIEALKSASLSVWQGPIVNQQGRTLVDAGSAIDDERRETMYFYVDGVEDRLPAR